MSDIRSAFIQLVTMDPAVLKTVLASQEQGYRGALEIFMNQMENKVQALQSSISELTRSLEFTQQDVQDLTLKVNQQQHDLEGKNQTIEDLNDKLKASGVHVKDLYERCNYQEDYNRRNNLQISGIEESRAGETWEQSATIVSKLLEEKLQLPNIQLERTHRVGRGGDLRPRPIVARFARFCDREAVLRNVRKLKGTRIFINEDLCPASHNIRKSQLPALKQARSEGKIAYFRHTKLIIKEKPASDQTSEPHSRDRGIERGRRGTSPTGFGDSGESGAPAAAAVPPVPSSGQPAGVFHDPGVNPSASAAATGGGGAGADPPADVGAYGGNMSSTSSSQSGGKGSKGQRTTRARK